MLTPSTNLSFVTLLVSCNYQITISFQRKVQPLRKSDRKESLKQIKQGFKVVTFEDCVQIYELTILGSFSRGERGCKREHCTFTRWTQVLNPRCIEYK